MSVKARLRRNYGSVAMLFSGTFVLVSGIAQPPFLRAIAIPFAVAIVAMAAYTAGARDAFARVDDAMNEATRSLPKSLRIHRDDAGRTHALIEQIGGDVVALEIPPELAHDRESVLHFVIDALARADDDDDHEGER